MDRPFSALVLRSPALILRASACYPAAMDTSPKVFDAYAASYDLLYRDKDYPGEAEYVRRLLKRFAPAALRILELGSGTGRHACLLAQSGYSVHGVERSPGMLETAKKSLAAAPSLAVEYSLGDVRSVRLGRAFDAAISLFHVASYQVSNADLADYLQTARAHVETGGLFVFDAWYGPAVLTDRPVVRVKRVEGDEADLVRIAEPRWLPNENVVEVHYQLFVREKSTGQVREIQELHRMRYVFLPELRGMLASSGWMLEHAEEWMTGRAPGEGTWGVCFICRAV